MKQSYEDNRSYATHLLSMIATSQELIRSLELTAERLPDMSDECGEQIKREKQQIRYYQTKLKEL